MKNIVDQIKKTLKLSTYASAHSSGLVRKHGLEYVGLCPFHNEKTPSFSVNDEKGCYYCFGCGAGGDLIKFIMEIMGLSYFEALKYLAKDAGLEVTTEDSKRYNVENECKKVLLAAAMFYYSELYDRPNVLKYFYDRGLNDELIRKYKLGFAPAGQKLYTHLKQLYNHEIIIKSGAVREKDYVYNPFGGRVIFPIFDHAGDVVGFGGRVLDHNAKMAKYINSHENDIFKKKHELYGMPFALREGVKSNEMICVEGYMDVLAMASAGITNVVAPLGAKLQIQQAEYIWSRGIDNINICFDADEAGKRAADTFMNDIIPHIKSGKSAKFIDLTDGKDPDEIIKNKGKDYMHELIKSASTISERVYNQLKRGYNMKIPEEKAAFDAKLNKMVQNFSDLTMKRHIKHYFNNRLFNEFRNNKRSNERKIEIPEFDTSPLIELSMLIDVLLKEGSILSDNFFLECFGDMKDNCVLEKNDDVISAIDFISSLFDSPSSCSNLSPPEWVSAYLSKSDSVRLNVEMENASNVKGACRLMKVVSAKVLLSYVNNMNREQTDSDFEYRDFTFTQERLKSILHDLGIICLTS